MKILAIEDEYAIREAITGVLSYEGFEVIVAKNGRIGVERAKEFLPDLIICDILMPELDGYGVLSELRKDPSTATIPFVFLTAKVDKDDLRLGMNLGADDYLVKPFRAQELLRAVRTRLEKQELIHQQSDRKLKDLRGNIIHALPHELRTPLTTILGFSSLLSESCQLIDSEQTRDMSKAINNAATRLERIIQNFLVYAQIELMAEDQEKLAELCTQTIDHPATIISDISRKVAQNYQREDDLELDLQDAVVQISEEDLKKIVEELVDNAFKFSTPNSKVKISTQLETPYNSWAKNPHRYTLTIHDFGRGITREQIASIGAYMQFDRTFYEQKGSGMGLIIAKRLTELHQGELNITSIPDQETTVRVRFVQSQPVE